MFWAKRDSSNPKVSIVVPVCNTSTFLRECLDSIVAQTLKEIEIICIDDGSTDNSLEILREYEAADARIHVITKPNAGYGHTMNMGFAAAKGDYIGIVESDDYIHPTMFESLYRYAKRKNCDLVKSNYFEHSEEGDRKIEPFAEFRYKWVFDPREVQGPLTALPIIWAGIYKRTLIEDNNVKFNETPGASYQDTSFMFQTWACARRAALLPDAYLYYRTDNAASSVQSAAKVFAVCGEYESSKAFLKADPERWRAFSEILNLLKIGTYRWNYNRVAPEFRLDFAKKMSEEYNEAREEGSLVRDYFNDHDWSQLTLLMDSPEKFVELYQDKM